VFRPCCCGDLSPLQTLIIPVSSDSYAAAQRINYHLIAQAIQSDQPEGRMRSPKLMQRSDAAAMDEVSCRAASFPYGGGR